MKENEFEAEVTVNDDNIYKYGVIISMTTGKYEGCRKLDKDQFKDDLPKDIVRGTNDIFDKPFITILKAIMSHDAATRNTIKSQTVPFPLDNIYFIPSRKIESIIGYMEERKAKRDALVQNAVDMYETSIENFAREYPDLYERSKNHYLTKGQFVNRFFLRYQFIKIQAPDQEGSFMSPEMYEAEKAKFRQTIEEMKREVLSIIYETLLETTERLKSQCENNKPNQLTINKLNGFLTQVEDIYSDFIDRKDIKNILNNIKKTALGIDAESLREDETLKNKFASEISLIAKEIKAMPDIPVKRALDF